MKRIIIDTNFLLIPLKFRVDIFSEFSRIFNFSYRLFIFEESINELKNIIQKQRGKDKKAAKFALKLIKFKNIEIIETGHKYVDELILDSINKDTVIATQDVLLKKQLLEKGASVIILRQKKYLKLLEKAL